MKLVLGGKATVADEVRAVGNDYDAFIKTYEQRQRRSWNAPIAVGASAGPLSVVIPARNAAATLEHVLDSLDQPILPLQVVVVDDASTDATPVVAAHHRSLPSVIRLEHRSGPGVARNVGAAVAEADTICFLDADVLVRQHALAEHAVRAADGLVTLGLRQDRSCTTPPGRCLRRCAEVSPTGSTTRG